VAAATLLHFLLERTTCPSSSIDLPSVHKTLLSSIISPGVKSRLFLAAALTPYHGITYTDSKKKSHPAVEAALREGLKLGTQNHYLDGIPALFVAADLLKNPTLGNRKLTLPSERVAIGGWFSPSALLLFVLKYFRSTQDCYYARNMFTTRTPVPIGQLRSYFPLYRSYYPCMMQSMTD
jgi:hypothetical protein